MKRLRPKYSAGETSSLYAAPHNHLLWGRGHGERVAESIRLGLLSPSRKTVADLSCGNGAIAKALCPTPLLGDYAPGYPVEGPIEDTADSIARVDLFVCCETLEHLDDPAAVLAKVRGKCTYLLLSTPTENWGDTNGEHYWAWSRADVEGILAGAGFSPREYSEIDSRGYGEPYLYSIWLCE